MTLLRLCDRKEVDDDRSGEGAGLGSEVAAKGSPAGNHRYHAAASDDPSQQKKISHVRPPAWCLLAQKWVPDLCDLLHTCGRAKTGEVCAQGRFSIAVEVSAYIIPDVAAIICLEPAALDRAPVNGGNPPDRSPSIIGDEKRKVVSRIPADVSGPALLDQVVPTAPRHRCRHGIRHRSRRGREPILAMWMAQTVTKIEPVSEISDPVKTVTRHPGAETAGVI